MMQARPAPEPTSLFDTADDAAEAAAIAQARTDIAAGRTIEHADVVAWLESWGTDDETVAPLPPAT